MGARSVTGRRPQIGGQRSAEAALGVHEGRLGHGRGQRLGASQDLGTPLQVGAEPGECQVRVARQACRALFPGVPRRGQPVAVIQDSQETRTLSVQA